MSFYLRLFIVYTIFFVGLVCGGCDDMKKESKYMKEPSQRDLFFEIQEAIKKYDASTPEIDKSLRQELLSIVSAKKCIPDVDGFMIDEWTFSRKTSRLYNHGFQIGNEHVWYEIQLQINSDGVKILKVSTNREHIMPSN